MRLKELWIKQSEHFNEALILFAERYGFLGAFEEDYVPRPIYPEGKALVAPEAVIDDRGRIRRVDPSTEGKDLLLDLLEPALRLLASNETEGIAKARIRHRHLIALPSDIQFIAKPPDLNSIWGPNSEQSFLVPWEVIKERFGALLILDKDAYKGVSVLYTREPRKRWIENLILFPAVDTPAKKLARYKDHISFNSYLEQAAPRAVLGKDGNLERSWNCRSLLQAMYVMLFLDLTGGNTIKKCQSRGCPNYFRVGSQSKSRYCSARCANRASTRMGRGQEP